MGEGELDRMCDEANHEWRRACVVADAVMLPTGVRSVAYANSHETADSNTARGNAHAAVAHAAVAHASPWPEPYDPAGDSDSDTGSLNAGLDRLGDHGACPGGFGRVDTAQRVDRARRDVPADGREPVRGQGREAAMTTVVVTAGSPALAPAERWLSSIPGLIDQIRQERDEWKARAEAAERKLVERASCCVENEERVRVRDARVEPPSDDGVVLVFDGAFWAPAFRPSLMPGHFKFMDPNFGCGPMREAPYWLPMPPSPEEKK